jgi:hypothetical protein
VTVVSVFQACSPRIPYEVEEQVHPLSLSVQTCVRSCHVQTRDISSVPRDTIDEESRKVLCGVTVCCDGEIVSKICKDVDRTKAVSNHT